MPDTADESSRLFGEKDIHRVLKRAAEMQAADNPTSSVGLSLAELQQVAAENGIDPAYVAAAAAELERAGIEDGRFHVWGAPLAIDLERTFEGEVSEEMLENMVAEIRRFFNTSGTVGTVGRSREWHYTRPLGEEQARVTLVPRDGRTHVRIRIRLTDGAAIAHATLLSFGLVLAILIPVLATLPPVLEGMISVVAFASLYVLARIGFGAFARARERDARQLMRRLLAMATGTPSERVADPKTSMPERSGLLTSPRVDEAGTEKTAGQRRSKTS